MKTPPREVEPDPSFTPSLIRSKAGVGVEGGGLADLSTRSCLRYRLHTLYALILTKFMRL